MGVKTCFEEFYREDTDAMQAWCDNMYISACGDSFDMVKQMVERMDAAGNVITDTELEWILTTLPLRLFSVAEPLNQLRLKLEYVKLKNQDIKSRRISGQDVSEPIPDQVEAKLVAEAFNSVIHRIENEISYSRELIMGAKKVWDARRRAEGSCPVGETVPKDDLPDYPGTSQYIK